MEEDKSLLLNRYVGTMREFLTDVKEVIKDQNLTDTFIDRFTNVLDEVLTDQKSFETKKWKIRHVFNSMMSVIVGGIRIGESTHASALKVRHQALTQEQARSLVRYTVNNIIQDFKKDFTFEEGGPFEVERILRSSWYGELDPDEEGQNATEKGRVPVTYSEDFRGWSPFEGQEPMRRVAYGELMTFPKRD